jgi:hypothetical protein
MEMLARNKSTNRFFSSRMKTRRITNGRKQSMYILRSTVLLSHALDELEVFEANTLLSNNPS